jgi:hypothetical protein
MYEKTVLFFFGCPEPVLATSLLSHTDIKTQDLWPLFLLRLDGGVTWQSAGAVSALDCGAVGDGVTDDWEALQGAVRKTPFLSQLLY